MPAAKQADDYAEKQFINIPGGNKNKNVK